MQAVILAAGSGKRIRDFHELPKGFIQLGEYPIVEQSILNLKNCGINKIFIVTGYEQEYYIKLAKKYNFIELIYNDKYEDFGSLYSLYLAHKSVTEDFLILESDIIYSPEALQNLLDCTSPDVILTSGFSQSNDEVFIECQDGMLKNMSKNKLILNTEKILGEFVGITKISLKNYLYLVQEISNHLENYHDKCYETDGLVFISKKFPLDCFLMKNLLWSEIDTKEHFDRAQKIFLQIRKNNLERKILLNPGPVTTTESVKNALLVPDLCHREDDFGKVLKNIRNLLLSAVHADESYTSILFASSGTGAVDAVLNSVIPSGKKLAILVNGSYGERLLSIARTYQIDCVVIESPAYEKLDLEKISTALKNDEAIYALAIVHHETSSGMLNPLEKIAEISTKYGKKLIVDAISSIGGIPIDVKKDRIDYLIGSSNKCLQGIPGLSFVICNKKELMHHQGKARSYYFDLYAQNDFLDKYNLLRFTAPVQVTYAFEQALNEYFQEGEHNRTQRYKDNFFTLISGLKELGFQFFLPQECWSHFLVVVKYPPSKTLNFPHLHDYFFEKGITIYPDKLSIENSFRLSCIGDLYTKDMQLFLKILTEYLQKF